MNFIKYLLPSKTLEVSPDELLLEYWRIYIIGEVRRPFSSLIQITEVYVPELQLVINREGNPINIFILDYDRYSGKDKMFDYKPKLVKTDKISKNSDIGKNLLWLAEVYKDKKEKENSLVELFP